MEMVEYLIPKQQMSEEDIKANFITPALVNKGWKNGSDILYEKSFTDGRVQVNGEKSKREKAKFTDYLLFYTLNNPIAVVEAKDNAHSVGHGLQQAMGYGQILDVPFVYSSNGDAFVEHDFLTGKERELALDEFPTKEELWGRWVRDGKLTEKEQAMKLQSYYTAQDANTPRYYQRIAINRTVEAVANGQERIMFVLATGTGKTYTAFQIIHRLMQAGLKKRVLYLADRKVLIEQPFNKDFKPFGNRKTIIDAKLLNSPEAFNSYEIYLGLYQQLAGEDGTETHYEKFGPNYFDLIVIDEAHRGSAKEESNWRKILDYFSSATQIGMTATPKEDNVTSNEKYFGKPIYTYSLKQGIDDGFLAPYRVIRVNFDIDVNNYRPEKGKTDKYGMMIEDRQYNRKDFDKTIVIDNRTKKVAKYVSDYLKNRNARFDKSIFFCVDIEHATRMRIALANENSDLMLEEPRYVMQMTSGEKEGIEQLENFSDPNEKYPVLVTTSKLLTTGVDAKTCKTIVLDANIQSMTEFKQIIGRGTRLDEDNGKTFFTIIDFRNVTNKFADPDFDGDPVMIIDGGDTPPKGGGNTPKPTEPPTPKYYVDDKEVKVVNATVQIIDADGKLITESLIDYSKKNVLGQYATLNDFIQAWSDADRKSAIIEELEKKGVFLDEIRLSEKNLTDIDDFDLLLQLAYGQKPLTKAERVNNVKKRGYLYQYSDEAREVLEILLDKYKDSGIENIEDLSVLKLPDFDKFKGITYVIRNFGGRQQYQNAVKELTRELYTMTA